MWHGKSSPISATDFPMAEYGFSSDLRQPSSDTHISPKNIKLSKPPTSHKSDEAENYRHIFFTKDILNEETWKDIFFSYSI